MRSSRPARRWLARPIVVAVFAAAALIGLVGARASCASTPGLSTLQLLDGAGLRDVLVYRPPVPDSARLPVVYFLHGLPGQPSDAVRAGLVAEAAALAAAGHPFVLAAPDGNGYRSDTEWADSADGRDRLESFLLDRVIPAVEGGARRTAALRGIIGFSMGGYGAANIALRNPAVFGAWGSVSGYFHVDDPDGVFGGSAAVEAANSPDRLAASARGQGIVLTEGASDPTKLVHGEAARMAGLLRAAGADPVLQVLPGEHDIGLTRPALDVLVTRLLAPYAPALTPMQARQPTVATAGRPAPPPPAVPAACGGGAAAGR